MPKIRTRSSAKKRFKRTASGLFIRRKAFRSHILTSKTSKRKRQLRKAVVVSKQDQKRVERMLNV